MGAFDRLKELAVGHFPGRCARVLRQAWQVIACDWDRLGWLANDHLAEYYVSRLCLPGKVFVDGGAHIGLITSEVRRNCPKAKIVAVEAIQEKAARLARKFPSIDVIVCALAERAGSMSFYVDLDNSAWSSLAATNRRVHELKVQARRLDDLELPGPVDILKLDLEGAELGALKGGDEIVRRDRPIVMFESGPTEYMGYSKSDMFDWLTARDFWIFLPSRLGSGAPAMSKEVYLDSHQYPFGTLNYFAVPAERVAATRERLAEIGTPSGLLVF